MPKQSKPRPGRGRKPQVDEFVPDFFAAVPQGAPGPEETNNIYIYNNAMFSSKNDINLVESPQNQEDQGPFDPKERIFLEKYLLDKLPIIKAMKLAGYGGYSDPHLYNLARKIVIRYEGWAGDARKVFRQAGVGETRLARTVDKLLNDDSSRVKLGAAELTAKVLRASQEPEAGSQGVRININIVQGVPASGPGAPALVQVDQVRPGIPTPTKPLQITK